MIFFFLVLIAMLLAFVAQQFIGPIPNFGCRVFLMQIVMFYGAVALPSWGMLGVAFTGGMMWDLFHVQLVENNEPEIGLGWSVVLYTVLCGFLAGFRPLFQRGRWELHCLLTGICVSVIPLAEYLMLSIRRQPVVFVFDKAIWWRIGGAGLTAAFLAPFFFFGLNYLSYLVSYNPHSERPKQN